MTSEQPLCGSFNPNVLEFLEHRWHEHLQVGKARLLVVGQRGIRQLIVRGIAYGQASPRPHRSRGCTIWSNASQIGWENAMRLASWEPCASSSTDTGLSANRSRPKSRSCPRTWP